MHAAKDENSSRRLDVLGLIGRGIAFAVGWVLVLLGGLFALTGLLILLVKAPGLFIPGLDPVAQFLIGLTAVPVGLSTVARSVRRGGAAGDQGL